MFKRLYQEYLQGTRGKTLGQKLDYIWYHYKTVIGVAALALVLIVSVIGHFATARDPLLKVIMINTDDFLPSAEAPFEEFFQEYGYECFDGAVQAGIYDLSDPMNPFYSNNVMSVSAKLSVEQDLFLGSGADYLDMANQGILADLSRILPPQVLEQYADCLLYCQPEGKDAYPCAIWLEDNHWVKDSGFYKACYLGIVERTANRDIALEFLEYVLK